MELTPDQSERINIAVRAAVLHELATIDFGSIAVQTIIAVPEDPFFGIGVKVVRT